MRSKKNVNKSVQKEPFVSRQIRSQGKNFKVEFVSYAKASNREPRLVLSSTTKNKKGGRILLRVGSVIHNDSKLKVIRVNWGIIKKWASKNIVSGGRVKEAFGFSTVEERGILASFLPHSKSFHEVILKRLGIYGVTYFSPNLFSWGRHLQDTGAPFTGVIFCLPSPYSIKRH